MQLLKGRNATIEIPPFDDDILVDASGNELRSGELRELRQGEVRVLSPKERFADCPEIRSALS